MAKSGDDRQKSVDRLLMLAGRLKLSEVTLSTSYGDPALKVRDKAFAVVKAPDVMVLHCPLDAKDVLLEMAPDVYYQTDHFIGWQGLLVRLDVIEDEELSLRLSDAWTFRAPKRLAATRAKS